MSEQYKERTQAEIRVREAYELADWTRDWGYEDVNTVYFDGPVRSEHAEAVREVVNGRLDSDDMMSAN